MVKPRALLLSHVSPSDWLELGERLGPTQQQALLALLEGEVSELLASRRRLGQIERKLAEGAALLDQVRRLRQGAHLEPHDERRFDAVIHMIEQTQRLFASH